MNDMQRQVRKEKGIRQKYAILLTVQLLSGRHIPLSIIKYKESRSTKWRVITFDRLMIKS